MQYIEDLETSSRQQRFCDMEATPASQYFSAFFFETVWSGNVSPNHVLLLQEFSSIMGVVEDVIKVAIFSKIPYKTSSTLFSNFFHA